MNILLVYPKYPDTFWSFKHALKFISKKAVNPPLGLITVSSMLPANWHKRLIDMNVEKLRDKDIYWGDYIFISAMTIQKESAKQVIQHCNSLHKKIIAGGPLFTEEPSQFSTVNHLVLNEAEITLPYFLQDLALGNAKHIYCSSKFADLSTSAIPDYSLVKTQYYNTLNLQYTRGCPFNCEFCDITALFGKKTRTKSVKQIILELEAIYETGWRKNVFFVDDNFIGNKKKLKTELLPALIGWMKGRNYPFTFSTEVSINLADDNDLLNSLVDAGFATVFIGIETIEDNSLIECSKTQNRNRDLAKCVRKIQEYGIEVSGGFILGFDNDTTSIFQKQIDFIRETGIISAMVGLLNAPKKTELYRRLLKENRIITEMSGDNTDFSLNFIPKMDKTVLLSGYKKVIRGIYEGKEYYKRVQNFISRFTPNKRENSKIDLKTGLAFLKTTVKLGIIDKYRNEYWSLMFWTLSNKPKSIPLAITYSVYGYHFRKVFKQLL